MMKLRLMILMALATLLLAACRGAQGPENIYIADEEDSGQTVTMGVGDALQIVLRENRSTGYLWSVVTNDESILTLSGEPEYAVDSDAEGAGGTVTYLFEAVAPGTSALRMVNAFQQETAVEPADLFELTVIVAE
jgi:predicted secreted protein